ncbi:MAG: response regulator [Bryobacteraceae bacterium]
MNDRRVLAVDDSATNRSIVKQQLSKIGMIVTCAANGAEALEELGMAARQGRPYELAILDLHMPVMNGLMLAREIRRGGAICGVPLMMLTSDRDRDDVAAARELGVRLFLVKPVKQASLIRSVAKMFGAAPVQAESDCLGIGNKIHRRVLVVEDNATNQKVIVLRLEKLGCSVSVANNGMEALEVTERSTYDLILMDCQMPFMGGLEATARIRDRGGRRIPIIALTANVMEGERERCLAAGMDDYLTKPVRLEDLVSKLQLWVGEKTKATVSGGGHKAAAAAEVRDGLQQFIAGMEEEGIGKDEVEILLNSFLETSAKLMEELETSIRDLNSPLMGKTAHTLKGSFATFGLVSLANLARELEMAAQGVEESAWDAVAGTMKQVAVDYQAARGLVAEALRLPTR